jgi:hypothetical protein
MQTVRGLTWAKFWRVAGIVAAVLGLVYLAALVPALVRQSIERPQSDLTAYYQAGARLNAGEPLYPSWIDVNSSSFFRYPPLLAILFRPLALLPFEVVAVGWAGTNLVLLFATIRRLGFHRRTAIAVAILAFPITWSLTLGQAQVLVTWLLVVASSWSIALATQLKIFPVLAALYWIGRRDWRSLRSFVLWTAALVLVQVIAEPRGSLAFLQTLTLGQVGGIDNLSPYGISPVAWIAFVGVLAGLALRLAPTRFGWAAAVFAVSLSTPRLISYWFMSLLAALKPEPATDRSALRDATP